MLESPKFKLQLRIIHLLASAANQGSLLARHRREWLDQRLPQPLG